jgi:hypothetical protein
MRLSFDDKESFMEAAAGSLRFNNPQSDSDPNTLAHQQVGSSSMPPEEMSEDICFNNPSNDPNTLQRIGTSSIQETWRSEDA